MEREGRYINGCFISDDKYHEIVSHLDHGMDYDQYESEGRTREFEDEMDQLVYSHMNGGCDNYYY